MVKTIWTWLLTAVSLVSFTQGAPSDDKLPPASSFYVPSIPGIVQDPTQPPLHIYSGHLPAEPDVARKNSNEVTAHIFFVLVKNRRVADKERIVFWFNGGPGCSSFDGLMMEVGPWRWDGKPVGQESFVTKPGGWEEYSTMVYVDQPPGTGYSFTATDSYAATMKDAQGYLLEFLKNFYSVFPEYRTMDTYMAGESYAGQWIPYFADALLDSHLSVPLKGVAIGNGWMDAKRHYLSYLDYAVKMDLISEGSEEYKEAKEEHDKCVKHLEGVKDEPIHIRACARIMLKIINKKMPNNDQGERMCMNMYDVRYIDTSPACGLNWPPEMHAISHFLGRKDVVHALHADNHPGAWVECKRDVHTAFKEDTEQSSITVLPRVLSKIPVMIFAGDQDLICNYVGLENMIKELTWNGAQGLGKVDTLNWSVNGTNTGTWVESRNLTYVKIFNASHMAPFDVPHLTHDMMLRFMNVDFSSIVSGSALIPSALGSKHKPVYVKPGDGKKTGDSASGESGKAVVEQNKAMWEAYYNAGSAALVLVLILLVIALFVWYRMRRRNGLKLPTTLAETREVEESIPLNSSMRDEEEAAVVGGSNGLGSGRLRSAGVKGKGRANEAVFDVGSDDEEVYTTKRAT